MIDPATIAAIERSARAALPAAIEEVADDWVLRASGGATKRVNSANPVAPGARVETMIDRAEGFYRAYGQPVRFRLSPLAEESVDAVLAARGYERIEESLTMIAPVGGHAIDPSVRLAPAVHDAWCAGFAAVSDWSRGENECHRALLVRANALAAATLVEDGQAIGFGIGSIAGDRLCLFDIATVAPARGRGVGRRLVASLLAWGAAADASEAVLQVLATNAAARRLYATLGFSDAYPYHYRIRSGEQRGDLGEG